MNNSPDALTPALRDKVARIFSRLRADGFQPAIGSGWRSVSEQAELVRKGRSKVLFSFHNVTLANGQPNAHAVDIVDARYGWGGPNANLSAPFWKALGKYAKAEGLTWGGDWRNFPDVAHVQLLPNSELRRFALAAGVAVQGAVQSATRAAVRNPGTTSTVAVLVLGALAWAFSR